MRNKRLSARKDEGCFMCQFSLRPSRKCANCAFLEAQGIWSRLPSACGHEAVALKERLDVLFAPVVPLSCAEAA